MQSVNSAMSCAVTKAGSGDRAFFLRASRQKIGAHTKFYTGQNFYSDMNAEYYVVNVRNGRIQNKKSTKTDKDNLLFRHEESINGSNAKNLRPRMRGAMRWQGKVVPSVERQCTKTSNSVGIIHDCAD